ncbi:MAG: hypothetical protein AB7G11_11880 [Phycisphaerales bacterium]
MKRTGKLAGSAFRGSMLGVVLALALTGCERESAETAAIAQARRDIAYLASHGGHAPENKSLSYDKVVSNLKQASSSSIQGEAEAAKLLRAEANMRAGDLLAGQAASAEQAALAKIIQLRETLDHWRYMNASASALRSFDPKSLLDDISKQATDKDTEIVAAAAELSTAEAALNQIQSQAREAQEKARAEHAREADLRAQAVGKSQVERADLVTRAVEASRAGDALDKQASDLLAQAQVRQAEVDNAKLLVDSLRTQRTLLDASRAEVERLVRVNNEQSQKTLEGESASERTGVKQLQAQIAQQASELADVRTASLPGADQTLDALYDAAKSRFDTAARELSGVKGSGTGGRSATTTLSTAASKHAAADLLITKARGLSDYAAILTALAEATPTIPGDFAAKASAAQSAYESTLKEAFEAYTAASSDYATAGGREQIERIKSRLESISATLATFNPSTPAPADAAPSDAATPPAEPGVADSTPPANPTPTPATQPLQGLEGEAMTFAQSLGEAIRKPDLQAFAEHVTFRNDKQKEFFNKTLPLSNKSIELDKAVKEHFHRSLTEIAKEQLARAGASQAGMFDDANQAILYLGFADPSDFSFAPSPDNPQIMLLSSTSGQIKNPIRFRKGDAWTMLLDLQIPPIELRDEVMQAMLKAYDSVIDRVRSGSFTDADQIFPALSTAMMQAYTNPGDPK